jgi:hypothetical protein
MHPIVQRGCIYIYPGAAVSSMFAGLYTGEYQKHAWVYVGEIPFPHHTKQSPLSLVRSASMESTQSEREFSKRYQAITHRYMGAAGYHPEVRSGY